MVPEKGCDDRTKLLIGVISSPSEQKLREWVRQTWANGGYLKESTKLVFVVGKEILYFPIPNATFNIDNSEQTHGDILALDIYEHYRNLSLKTVGLLSYAQKYCQNLKCIMKTDSDVILNVRGTQKLCDSLSDHKNIITGKIFSRPFIMRNSNDRWYVPKYVYPKNNYPVFASGPFYLLSGYGIAQKMLVALKENTPFYGSENYRRMSEDVIFTGDVREAAQIEPNHHDGFQLYEGYKKFYYTCYNTTNMPLGFVHFWRSTKGKVWDRMKLIFDKQESCVDK